MIKVKVFKGHGVSYFQEAIKDFVNHSYIRVISISYSYSENNAGIETYSALLTYKDLGYP